MHPGWLVESAGMWGYHSTRLAASLKPLQLDALPTYWLRCKLRFDAWDGLLRDQVPELHSSDRTRRRHAWTQLEGLIAEVLLAEPLTRVSVAIAMQLDRSEADGESGVILHHVFRRHQLLRFRCLQLILHSIDVGSNSCERINRLRAYLEQWTDMLLGFFADPVCATEYTHSLDRACEFAEDYSFRTHNTDAATVWSLFLAGNLRWLEQHATCRIPFPELNREVTQAALGMVHAPSTGSPNPMHAKLAQRLAEHFHFVDRSIDRLLDRDCLASCDLGISLPSQS